MSKNAIKKMVKTARLATLKLERRAREKEAKKEKKRVRAEKRAKIGPYRGRRNKKSLNFNLVELLS
jgi:hypothetical protein